MQFKDNRETKNPYVIRLKSGEYVTGVLRGEIFEFKHAYNEEEKPKFRFRLNIVVNENGALTARIIEGGWKMYGQLRDLAKSGWDLEKTYTRISRQGTTKTDTVYTCTVLPTPVPNEVLERIATVTLRDLTDNRNGLHPPTNTPDETAPIEDLPF